MTIENHTFKKATTWAFIVIADLLVGAIITSELRREPYNPNKPESPILTFSTSIFEDEITITATSLQTQIATGIYYYDVFVERSNGITAEASGYIEVI